LPCCCPTSPKLLGKLRNMDPNGVPIIPTIKFCLKVLHVLGLVAITPIAQYILNRTVVTLPFSVVYPCDTPYAELDNDATIHIPGPFDAVLDEYNVTLSTEAVDAAGRTLKVGFGSSTFPKMTLKHGTNNLDFTTGVALSDVDALLNHFILPMFTEGKKVKLFIDVSDVTVHILGGLATVPKLHMHKVLTCHGANTTAPKEVPDKYCHPKMTMDLQSPQMNQPLQQMLGRRLQSNVGGQFTGYQMQCVAAERDSSDPSVVV